MLIRSNIISNLGHILDTKEKEIYETIVFTIDNLMFDIFLPTNWEKIKNSRETDITKLFDEYPFDIEAIDDLVDYLQLLNKKHILNELEQQEIKNIIKYINDCYPIENEINDEIGGDNEDI